MTTSTIKQSLIVLILLLAINASNSSYAAGRKQPWNQDGQFHRAFVIDDGLSALRNAPAADALCVRRLHVGRALYVLAPRAGTDYYQVAVTRRTRGFIDRAAIAIPGQRGDDERLMRLIAQCAGADKILLARVLRANFPASNHCAAALLAEGEEAMRMAEVLSARARHRPPQLLDRELDAERYWRNYPGLDRYSRLGLKFICKQARFYYDGAAFRKILTRYPHSDAAPIARKHLDELQRSNDSNDSNDSNESNESIKP